MPVVAHSRWHTQAYAASTGLAAARQPQSDAIRQAILAGTATNHETCSEQAHGCTIARRRGTAHSNCPLKKVHSWCKAASRLPHTSSVCRLPRNHDTDLQHPAGSMHIQAGQRAHNALPTAQLHPGKAADITAAHAQLCRAAGCVPAHSQNAPALCRPPGHAHPCPHPARCVFRPPRPSSHTTPALPPPKFHRSDHQQITVKPQPKQATLSR